MKYTYVSAGLSKDAVFRIAQSLATDPDGGIGSVQAKNPSAFTKDSFPCMGWVATLGGTAGIFQPPFMSRSGLSASVFLFGFAPFAGVRAWGRFNSIMPSVGPSFGICSF